MVDEPAQLIAHTTATPMTEMPMAIQSGVPNLSATLILAPAVGAIGLGSAVRSDVCCIPRSVFMRYFPQTQVAPSPREPLRSQNGNRPTDGRW